MQTNTPKLLRLSERVVIVDNTEKASNLFQSLETKTEYRSGDYAAKIRALHSMLFGFGSVEK